MSGLEKALFNLKACLSLTQSPYPNSRRILTHSPLLQFTAKQLNRQAAKASKDEKTEKDKLKKVRCHLLIHPTIPIPASLAIYIFISCSHKIQASC